MAVAPDAIHRVESVDELMALPEPRGAGGLPGPDDAGPGRVAEHPGGGPGAVARSWVPGRSDLCFATTNRQAALRAIAAAATPWSSSAARTRRTRWPCAHGAGRRLPAWCCASTGPRRSPTTHSATRRSSVSPRARAAPEDLVQAVIAAPLPHRGRGAGARHRRGRVFPPPRELRELMGASTPSCPSCSAVHCPPRPRERSPTTVVSTRRQCSRGRRRASGPGAARRCRRAGARRAEASVSRPAAARLVRPSSTGSMIGFPTDTATGATAGALALGEDGLAAADAHGQDRHSELHRQVRGAVEEVGDLGTALAGALGEQPDDRSLLQRGLHRARIALRSTVPPSTGIAPSQLKNLSPKPGVNSPCLARNRMSCFVTKAAKGTSRFERCDGATMSPRRRDVPPHHPHPEDHLEHAEHDPRANR